MSTSRRGGMRTKIDQNSRPQFAGAVTVCSLAVVPAPFPLPIPILCLPISIFRAPLSLFVSLSLGFRIKHVKLSSGWARLHHRRLQLIKVRHGKLPTSRGATDRSPTTPSPAISSLHHR